MDNTKNTVEYFSELRKFVNDNLVEGIDYTSKDGDDNPFNKPSLLKPGAEKVLHWLEADFQLSDVTVIEHWQPNEESLEPFFFYRRRCTLYDMNGNVIGSAEGSANSREIKYRYRTVNEQPANPNSIAATITKRSKEPKFAVEKAETTGKYGKPQEYWDEFNDAIASGTAKTVNMKLGKWTGEGWEVATTAWRVYNQDIYEVFNTVLKMADKRALIAVVLIAAGMSEFFTQDIEDMDDEVVPTTSVTTQKVAQAPAPARVSNPSAQSFAHIGEAMTWAMGTGKFATSTKAKTAIDAVIKKSGKSFPDITSDIVAELS